MKKNIKYDIMFKMNVGDKMKYIYDYTRTNLVKELEALGMKKFKADQIYRWLYDRRVLDFEQMSDLSKVERQLMNENFGYNTLKLKVRQESKDGTIKYLFELYDGSLIETVLMSFDYGDSVCVTTQIGCNMGCTFCASGLLKKKRNLTTGEIVSQIMYVQKDIDNQNRRVSHIVIMGIGEPFDNFQNVLDFLSIVNDDLGLKIGARHITISTCGIVPKIREFADLKLQYNLAISLHAPNNELRKEIMPITRAYPLEKLMESIDYYLEKNNRRVTFEYILLDGINDKIEHADQLADLLRGKNAYVNLIPYNKVVENQFEKTPIMQSMKFYDRLCKRGIRCTIRKEQGADIDAACGQLRAKHEKRGV